MSSLSLLAGRIIEDLQVVKMPRRARAIRRDKRRDAFYDNILKNAQINFDNKEIQDIQKGVRTYLERLTTRMNEGHALKISYIQPCGSMEEKSSILKVELPYYYAETVDTKYIELDYLAILDTPDDIRLDEGCPGCRTSYSWLTDNIFNQICSMTNVSIRNYSLLQKAFVTAFLVGQVTKCWILMALMDAQAVLSIWILVTYSLLVTIPFTTLIPYYCYGPVMQQACLTTIATHCLYTLHNR